MIYCQKFLDPFLLDGIKAAPKDGQYALKLDQLNANLQTRRLRAWDYRLRRQQETNGVHA